MKQARMDLDLTCLHSHKLRLISVCIGRRVVVAELEEAMMDILRICESNKVRTQVAAFLEPTLLLR